MKVQEEYKKREAELEKVKEDKLKIETLLESLKEQVCAMQVFLVQSLGFVVKDICPSALLVRMPSPGFEQLSLGSEGKLPVKFQDGMGLKLLHVPVRQSQQLYKYNRTVTEQCTVVSQLEWGFLQRELLKDKKKGLRYQTMIFTAVV